MRAAFERCSAVGEPAVVGAHDVGRRLLAPRGLRSTLPRERGQRLRPQPIDRGRARPRARSRGRRPAIASSGSSVSTPSPNCDRGVELGAAFAAGQCVLRRRLPDLERERSEVDEVRDCRVHAGLGHHRAAVGVADEHRVAVERVERRRGRTRRRRGASRRGDDTDGRSTATDRSTGRVEPRDHLLPAPRAVPGAVDEHDGAAHGRLRPRIPIGRFLPDRAVAFHDGQRRRSRHDARPRATTTPEPTRLGPRVRAEPHPRGPRPAAQPVADDRRGRVVPRVHGRRVPATCRTSTSRCAGSSSSSPGSSCVPVITVLNALEFRLMAHFAEHHPPDARDPPGDDPGLGREPPPGAGRGRGAAREPAQGRRAGDSRAEPHRDHRAHVGRRRVRARRDRRAVLAHGVRARRARDRRSRCSRSRPSCCAGVLERGNRLAGAVELLAIESGVRADAGVSPVPHRVGAAVQRVLRAVDHARDRGGQRGGDRLPPGRARRSRRRSRRCSRRSSGSRPRSAS